MNLIRRKKFKYLEEHNKLSFCRKMNMEEISGDLMKEDKNIMEAYN
jgi:hypothetical protein